MTEPASPLRAATSGGAGALDSYLGAARVVRVAARSLLVALEEEEIPRGTLVHATPALAFPYRAIAGDQLLVIGDAAAFYVIGVLNGRGESDLSNPKGVSLRAEGGRLHLAGDRGVRLTGSRIHLEAERLRRLAATAVQAFGAKETLVRERHEVQAGDIDELSQSRWLLQARRVVLKALTNARIRSTTVRVG